MKGYKKGVYRTSEILGDANIDVIVFDGNRWWVGGWEVGLYDIDESKIKELLWEWDEQTKREKLTYKERIDWFVSNFYETGMEYNLIYDSFRTKDLDRIEWYNDIIKIPEYKDEL